MPTTVERDTTKTVIVTQKRTTTSTITETVTPTLLISTVVSTALVTVSPTCTSRINTDGQICPATITMTAHPLSKQETKPIQGDISKPMHVVNTEMSAHFNTQQAPTIALGIVTGLFFIALVAVIIGWVWTCWTIKKRGELGITSKNM